jgi:hypothetical protein
MNSQPVIIYISAAPDLTTERETLARMIAELPVTLAWRIVQTPTGAEQLDTAALLKADLYFLVMGGDIRAPVGLELHTAQRAGKPVNAYLQRDSGYTPAGQVFIRQAGLTWQPFAGAASLSRHIRRRIVEHLVRHAIEYVLSPTELSQLETLLTAEAGAEPAASAEGAGHSAVILSRERYTPSEGVIVEGKKG